MEKNVLNIFEEKPAFCQTGYHFGDSLEIATRSCLIKPAMCTWPRSRIQKFFFSKCGIPRIPLNSLPNLQHTRASPLQGPGGVLCRWHPKARQSDTVLRTHRLWFGPPLYLVSETICIWCQSSWLNGFVYDSSSHGKAAGLFLNMLRVKENEISAGEFWFCNPEGFKCLRINMDPGHFRRKLGVEGMQLVSYFKVS